MVDKRLLKEVMQPLDDASAEVRDVVLRVLEMERDKLYLERPHMVDDLIGIMKEAVR